MKKARDIFNYIIALCLFIAAVIVLAVSTVTTIRYDMGADEDFPHYVRENIPLLVILVAAVLGIFFLIYKKGAFEKASAFAKGALIFILCYCLMLILVIRPIAANDSMEINKIINEFMQGDYHRFNPGEYLFVWPFQLGYVAFGQVMSLIFGTSNFVAWDIVQLISILITICLIYRITWEFFEDKVICGIVALLSCGALFFYNYVTYIYGDILSMAPQTLALYMMVLYMKRDKVRYAVISAFAIAFAILVKTNCEIALIALLMVLWGSVIPAVKDEAFDKSKIVRSLIERAILTALFLALTFGFKGAVNAYYCNVAGLDAIPKGNPAMAHIAMGLQESELEDGWFNDYNYQVFDRNNYDYEATKAEALENIKESLHSYITRPLHGGKFFLRKFSTQWADSVCISTHNLELVSRHVEGQSPLCNWIIWGDGMNILAWIMNVFMPVCYIGVAIYLFGILRGRKASVPEMLLLILIFGGIVFHEFWEGSSRYVMRYYIYYLPFGAYGLKVLLGFICEHTKRKI